VRAADVAYDNAHGTGTPANDAAEGRALRRMFGERPPPVSASKSFLGHTLGAAGAIEAVVTLLAVREGFLPATLHTTAPADDAPPDLVLGAARDADVPYALSTSFAFGGNNAALLFGRAP
jgi:3-oxoacyl-[acyl-carrier-protein] synthase II